MPVHQSHALEQSREPTEGRRIKQERLSVWHRDRLHEHGVVLEDLLIENLAGYGQAHHRAGDYTELARQVSENAGEAFQVQVEWRPEDEYVDPPWRQWRYAHVQVEAIAGPGQFLRRFRKLLTVNSRVVIPPGP